MGSSNQVRRMHPPDVRRSAALKATALEEFKQSWIVLLACSLGAAVGAAAFPLFLVPVIGLRLEDAFGWSRLDTSSLTSIAFLGGALGVPIAGWLNDRWSMKWPVIGSMAGVGGMLLLGAIAPPDIIFWQAGIFCLMLLGAGTLSASFSKVICATFDAMRGLALGLTIGSVSMVSAVALPWFSTLIDRYGTDGFFLGAGAFYFIFILPLLWWLLPDAPPAAGMERTNGPVPASRPASPRSVWILGIAGILLAVVAGSGAHLAAIAADGNRVSPAAVGSVFALGVLVSRPVAGLVIDHVSAKLVGAASALVAAVGLILAAVYGDRFVLVSAILLATCVGAEFDIVAYLASKYVSASQFGIIFGWMYGGMLLAAASGPILIALQLDLFGSYRTPLLLAALLAAIAALLISILPPYAATRRHRHDP